MIYVYDMIYGNVENAKMEGGICGVGGVRRDLRLIMDKLGLMWQPWKMKTMRRK